MVDTVGIIGAGQMGNGIAHISALAGMNVVLTDMTMQQAEKGLSVIKGNMERQVGKGKITAADMEAGLTRITLGDSNVAHGDCDLVIEAAARAKRSKKLSSQTCANT